MCPSLDFFFSHLSLPLLLAPFLSPLGSLGLHFFLGLSFLNSVFIPQTQHDGTGGFQILGGGNELP